MMRFTVEKIADYWRVMDERKLVSSHRTEKAALRARRKAESALPSPRQVYRDYVEGTFFEAGREC